MRVIFLLMLIGLVSCKNSTVELPAPYHDAATQFIVSDIQQLDGMKGMTTYLVEIVDVNGLVHVQGSSRENLTFWFCDTLGKYKLGQPIHFDKQR